MPAPEPTEEEGLEPFNEHAPSLEWLEHVTQEGYVEVTRHDGEEYHTFIVSVGKS